MERKSESRKCFEDGQFAVQGIMAGMQAEPNPEIVNTVRKIAEGANKVENKIYNDDVERIVNNPERLAIINERYYNRQKKKQRKNMIDGCVYATFTLAFGVLGCIGWMTPWIAFPVFGLCALYATFCFGRYYENGKCWGWK